MTDFTTEAQAVSALAGQALAPQSVDINQIYTVADQDGGVRLIDTDQYGPGPRRATGRRIVTDAYSFVTYLDRHSNDQTEVFADKVASTVIAVLDSNTGFAKPNGWQGHTVKLELVKTIPWLAWLARDLTTVGRGAWFGQEEFAEFIQERATDCVSPDSATLLELATSFQANNKVDFKSAVNTGSGQINLGFDETITAKAGQKGNIPIPTELKLRLRPYIGGPIYNVTAQFRFRLNGGDLRLGFAIVRPQDILDAAFTDIVDEIRDGKDETIVVPGVGGAEATTEKKLIHTGTDAPIFFGKPA
ncbi:DUF2303 family protein [Cryobacterium sp. PH31-O1]|uniref:DUF2303 family protein n=1 Tax=Cryobacterium sp. PH31-O1 TaxID=3046306 RepID=UPI0024BB9DF5|nr:DUF2303 family protein [Cryobacterium sp. PH31-O1]MDJ0337431.1 DUF2303 family protein [Cryobacterium sp. PH31-O1]